MYESGTDYRLRSEMELLHVMPAPIILLASTEKPRCTTMSSLVPEWCCCLLRCYCSMSQPALHCTIIRAAGRTLRSMLSDCKSRSRRLQHHHRHIVISTASSTTSRDILHSALYWSRLRPDPDRHSLCQPLRQIQQQQFFPI